METIRLYNRFKIDTLRNRSTARKLVEEITDIPDSEQVVVDFKSIVFASRSFCHELFSNLKDRKQVYFRNVNPEIERMQEVVINGSERKSGFVKEKSVLLVKA